MKIAVFLLLFPLLGLCETHTVTSSPVTDRPVAESSVSSQRGYGIRFTCTKEQSQKLKVAMVDLFQKHNLQGTGLITLNESQDGTVLEYSLNSAEAETDTFGIAANKTYNIPIAREDYITQQGQTRTVNYSSRKEILLALMQRGRLTEFKGKSCSIDALEDHIGMRQNIARWGAKAWFTFPEDGVEKPNADFWESGTWSVKASKSPVDAIQDAFTGLKQYAIGCTKAVQLIVSQGILEYQRNRKKNPELVKKLESQLGTDPLNVMEPKGGREGVLVDRQTNVPWNNWVPGDWGWIRNDDQISSNDYGYEGCNIVYLGGGYFAVYYDNDPDRTLDQALIRVYHWRDMARRENISDQELLKRIRKDPYDGGGMLRSVRDVPKRFE